MKTTKASWLQEVRQSHTARVYGRDTLRLPANSPNLNAYAERFVLSIRRECLDRFVPLSERHLRTAVTEYVVHYHTERNHQGLGNELLTPLPASANDAGPIVSRERLGGILNYYCVPRRWSPATVACASSKLLRARNQELTLRLNSGPKTAKLRRYARRCCLPRLTWRTCHSGDVSAPRRPRRVPKPDPLATLQASRLTRDCNAYRPWPGRKHRH